MNDDLLLAVWYFALVFLVVAFFGSIIIGYRRESKR